MHSARQLAEYIMSEYDNGNITSTRYTCGKDIPMKSQLLTRSSRSLETTWSSLTMTASVPAVVSSVAGRACCTKSSSNLALSEWCPCRECIKLLTADDWLRTASDVAYLERICCWDSESGRIFVSSPDDTASVHMVTNYYNFTMTVKIKWKCCDTVIISFTSYRKMCMYSKVEWPCGLCAHMWFSFIAGSKKPETKSVLTRSSAATKEPASCNTLLSVEILPTAA